MGGGRASNGWGGGAKQARQTAHSAQLWHSSAWYIPFLCQTVPACTYLYASALSVHMCLSPHSRVYLYTHAHLQTRTHTRLCAVAPFGYCDLSASGHIYSLYCLVDVLVLVLLLLLVLLHIIPKQHAINVHSKSNFSCPLRACLKYH